jgi:Flp pilus assembly protein TadD
MLLSHEHSRNTYKQIKLIALTFGCSAFAALCVFADEPVLEIKARKDSPREVDPLMGSIFGTPAQAGSVAPRDWSLPSFSGNSLFPDQGVAEPTEPEESEESNHLMELAMRVAPAVVAMRVWDEFGMELAQGAGFFISPEGMFLTDAGMLHPKFAGEVSYITVQTGDGSVYRVDGILHYNINTGIAVLKADAKRTPYLELSDPKPFKGEEPITLVSVSESRGLGMADATASFDNTLSGAGWINISGADSPGAQGSPVFDQRGEVIGVVALHVPLGQWVNFAKPIAPALSFLRGAAMGSVRPLSSLSEIKNPKMADSQDLVNAILDMKENRFKTAAKTLIGMAREYPREAAPWALLGLASAQLGATEEAMRCQQKAAALDPTSGDHWINLASTELVYGAATDREANVDSVLESLQKASMERPGDTQTWKLLSNHLIKHGDFEAADIALQQLTKLRSNDSDAFYMLGFIRSRAGDLNAAEMALIKSVKIRESDDAWFLLGLVLSKKQDYEGASEAYKQAAKVNPNHPNAWLNLADSYRKAGKENEAKIAYREHRTRQKEGS